MPNPHSCHPDLRKYIHPPRNIVVEESNFGHCVGTVVARGSERQRVRNKNSISVSEFRDFKQQRYDSGGETCFTCQQELARVTILFFEGARGGEFCTYTYTYIILYDIR